MGVGISAGANFVGALQVQDTLGREAVVVTVFPDDNKKYLSTDLLRDEPVRGGFLTPHVKLLAVRAFKRVCDTCCDPRECLDAASPELAEDRALPLCPRGPQGRD